MPTFAYNVQGLERAKKGITLLPGFPFSEQFVRKGLKALFKGAPVELRFPNGERRSLSVTAVAAAKRLPTDPPIRDPLVQVTVAHALLVPVDTELWVLDGSSGDHRPRASTPEELETIAFNNFSFLYSQLNQPASITDEQLVSLTELAVPLHKAGRIAKLEKLGRIKNVGLKRLGPNHPAVEQLARYLANVSHQL